MGTVLFLANILLPFLNWTYFILHIPIFTLFMSQANNYFFLYHIIYLLMYQEDILSWGSRCCREHERGQSQLDQLLPVATWLWPGRSEPHRRGQVPWYDGGCGRSVSWGQIPTVCRPLLRLQSQKDPLLMNAAFSPNLKIRKAGLLGIGKQTGFRNLAQNFCLLVRGFCQLLLSY